LGDLPELSAALAAGELPFSAVRELTRVVTPATEASWMAAASGKNLRQIEDLVADHRPGDRPDDPPDPAARTHVVRFELSAEAFALLRQARRVLVAALSRPEGVSRPACSTGRAFANFDIREFANGSDAFTCSEVLVASAWIRPNTTRW